MNNPFLSKHQGNEYLYLDQSCSINNVVIAKIPVDGIEEEIIGRCAKDIFSTKVIVEYIKDNADKLHIDIDKTKENDFPKEVNRCLASDDNQERETAEKIIKKFGYRLGICLLVLKTGLKENREARKEWTDKHWDYLSKVKRVILVGGLANDVFGEKLKNYALEIFEKANIAPYDILLFSKASHLGVAGGAKLIKHTDKVNMVFDFGQTFMKRSIIYNNGKNEKMLKSIRSKYMQINTNKDANALHLHILSVIIKTYEEAKKIGDVGDEIIISIANYAIDNKLNSIRGGYAKLASLSKDYVLMLEKDLEYKIGKKFNISFVHDGTAMAMNFSEYKNTLCISMGTFFGMGCPDCILNLENDNTEI